MNFFELTIAPAEAPRAVRPGVSGAPPKLKRLLAAREWSVDHVSPDRVSTIGTAITLLWIGRLTAVYRATNGVALELAAGLRRVSLPGGPGRLVPPARVLRVRGVNGGRLVQVCLVLPHTRDTDPRATVERSAVGWLLRLARPAATYDALLTELWMRRPFVASVEATDEFTPAVRVAASELAVALGAWSFGCQAVGHRHHDCQPG